jgi:ribosome modulation factor
MPGNRPVSALLQESLNRAKRAWKLGYEAEDRCQHRNACPFADVPGQRMEREAWMRGFARSARDRLPATE